MVQFPDMDEQVDISMKNPSLTNNWQKIKIHTHTQKADYFLSCYLLLTSLLLLIPSENKKKFEI